MSEASYLHDVNARYEGSEAWDVPMKSVCVQAFLLCQPGSFHSHGSIWHLLDLSCFCRQEHKTASRECVLTITGIFKAARTLPNRCVSVLWQCKTAKPAKVVMYTGSSLPLLSARRCVPASSSGKQVCATNTCTHTLFVTGSREDCHVHYSARGGIGLTAQGDGCSERAVSHCDKTLINHLVGVCSFNFLKFGRVCG